MGFRDWLLSPLTDHLNMRMNRMAKTLDDVKAQTAALIDSVKKNTDLTDSIKTLVNGLRSQIDDLKQQVADLQAAGGASPDDLQALSDQLGAAITSIDADSAAESAIAGTEADPNPVPAQPA